MNVPQIKFVRLVFAGIVVFWTAAVIAGYFIAGDYIRQSKFDLLKSAARSSMQKDIAYRHLFASLERIYVPQQTGIKANPFLDSRQKETVTLDGQHLVQLNPAYITRLFYEMDSTENSGARATLVSLKPLNPQNAPDQWQEKGLRSLIKRKERQSGPEDMFHILIKTRQTAAGPPRDAIRGRRAYPNRRAALRGSGRCGGFLPLVYRLEKEMFNENG